MTTTGPTPQESPTQAKTPGPAELGPRPLPLHLALQTMAWLSSQIALPHLRNGSLNWSPEFKARAESLRADLQGVPAKAFAEAVEAEVRRRAGRFLAGVEAYRSHPRQSRLTEPPVLWQDGTTRVLDYGACHASSRNGVPLLVVPSLINRAYVLDLSERCSLLRSLAGEGFRPLLVDWGAPGADERCFTLDDYIAGRLETILDRATDLAGCKVGVLGYCMGGLLALALAQRKPRHVAALALMATPWDFHADAASQVRWLKATAPQITALVAAFGNLPVDVMQAMFASLDPFSATRKFQAFAGMGRESDRAREFISLEDWLNDGIPLAAPVAMTCLLDWYVDNGPAEGRWRVADRPVVPEEVPAPALVVVPSHDHIVPPASAEPLARALPRATRLDVSAGHIGMVVGRQAPRILYEPMAEWLKARI